MYICALVGTLFVTVIVEDSTVMGVTEQLSAITTNEGDMDVGGGGVASGGGGGASLLSNQQGGGGGTDNRTLNPFGGSPSSLGGNPGPHQFNQSNATILPNLLPTSAIDNSSNTMPTGMDLLSRRQLLGNTVSELTTSITAPTDRVQPDIVPGQGEMSGSNSTQEQHGTGTGRQPGPGTGPQECGSLENMMSSDDFGADDIYPS